MLARVSLPSRKEISVVALLFLTIGFLFTYKSSDHARYWSQDLMNRNEISAVALGSSSITALPLDLFEQCAGLVSRGFGGGTLTDLSFYLDFSLLPNSLKLVLVYAGENDIVYGETTDRIITRFKNLTARLATKFPQAKIVIIKTKLAPARFYFHPELLILNQKLELLNDKPKITVVASTLSEYVRSQYYIADGVHLSREGYRVLLMEVPKEC